VSDFLKAEAVGKSYPEGGREVSVLKDLNLEVNSGETVSIIGASGSGKSTLLHILGALDTPTAGKVTFEGRDLFALKDAALAQFRNERLGFVFQFHHLLPEFSALENVMMPLILRREPSVIRHEKAIKALDDVGLVDKISSLPGELSGGEQQRIAVARAIVSDPSLLLADEPTGNLDRETGDSLMNLLFDLNQQRGLTVIYVSHNDRLAERAARRLRLQDGHLNL